MIRTRLGLASGPLLVVLLAGSQAGCGLIALLHSRSSFPSGSADETVPGEVRTVQVAAEDLVVEDVRVVDDRIAARLVLAPPECAEVRDDTVRTTLTYDSVLYARGSGARITAGQLWLWTAVDAALAGAAGGVMALCFGASPPEWCGTGDPKPGGWVAVGVGSPFALGFLLDLYQHGANVFGGSSETSEKKVETSMGSPHPCGVAQPFARQKFRVVIGSRSREAQTDADGAFGVTLDLADAELLVAGVSVIDSTGDRMAEVQLAAGDGERVVGLLKRRADEQRAEVEQRALAAAHDRRQAAVDAARSTVKAACERVGAEVLTQADAMYAGSRGAQLRTGPEQGAAASRGVEPGMRVSITCRGQAWVVVADTGKSREDHGVEIPGETVLSYVDVRELELPAQYALRLIASAKSKRKQGLLEEAKETLEIVDTMKNELD